MTRKELLNAAERYVCLDREGQYGGPENNFQLIANLWTEYLTLQARPVKAHDVACMMALLKIARIRTGYPNDDNWADLAGYAACGAEMQETEVLRELEIAYDKSQKAEEEYLRIMTEKGDGDAD